MDQAHPNSDSDSNRLPHSENWQARRELAELLRQLTGTLVTTSSDTASLRTVAAQLQTALSTLRQAPRLAGQQAFAQAAGGRLQDWQRISHELNPLAGRCNPLAMPLNVWKEGDGGRGRVSLDWTYEGLPGAVHGGYVCALLDHFLGLVQNMGGPSQPSDQADQSNHLAQSDQIGQFGLTGTLKVRFHQPTPLHTELELYARIRKARRHSKLLIGEIRAQGQLTASCEALFISSSQTLPERLGATQK